MNLMKTYSRGIMFIDKNGEASRQSYSLLQNLPRNFEVKLWRNIVKNDLMC
jgi:hypothetical protein